ncbi:MAG: hypothetical protein K2K26_11285 [Muribaculaceae bacterium]|nr:hypothetical protein [Muribaculaceae bacterium]
MMKQLALVSLLMLSGPMWTFASAPIDLWQTNFKNGRFPSGITTAALSEAQPIKDRYKNGYTEDGWIVKVFGKVYCALSPTSTGVDTPVENVLNIPAVTLPNEAEGAIVRWTARSVLPGMPEAYEVRVRTENSDTWQLLCRVEEEQDVFTTHVAHLEEYAGQKIELQFACVSVNRYMLAIGEIYVGIPSAPLLTGQNPTPRFAENASPRDVKFSVFGSMLNCGAEIAEGSSLIIRSENEDNSVWPISQTVKTGETLDFDIPFEAPDNATTEYEVVLATPDGNEYQVIKSDVTRSGFARNLLVDEGTGIWCNNCPDGILEIARLEEQYPGQMIAVCTHTNDILANEEYWSHLNFYAIPYYLLNRKKSTAGGNTKKFADSLNDPTIASIQVSEGPTGDWEHVTATVEVMFDRDLDDPGRYGVGYVLTSPYYRPDGNGRWMQQNSCNIGSSEQYYFLPSVIPAQLSFYKHVSLSATHAFDPVEVVWDGNPTVVPAYTPGYVTLDFGELFTSTTDESVDPATVPDNISLVAFVIDNTDGTVLNATVFPLQQEFDKNSGVTPITSDSETKLRVVNGELRFTLPESDNRYEVTITNAAGITLARYEGHDRGTGTLRLPSYKGIMIVTLHTSNSYKSIKVIN